MFEKMVRSVPPAIPIFVSKDNVSLFILFVKIMIKK
jgi:hypothetical protein